NVVREKLTAAAQLLDGFVSANPKAPEAPAALLKLGHCAKRLGATLADPTERNRELGRAREVYERLGRDYPKDPLAGQAKLEQAKDPQRTEWVPLLRYHHAVAIVETGKPADARPLFDEVAKQAAGKPLGAEAALRGGQCRVAEAKKKVQDAQQAKAQAGNDPG